MSEKKKPLDGFWGWGIRKMAEGGVGWGGRGGEGKRSGEESYRNWGGEGMVWVGGKKRETGGGGGER